MEKPNVEISEFKDLDSSALLKEIWRLDKKLNFLKISDCEFELENAVSLLFALQHSSVQDLEISSSLPGTGEKVRLFILDRLRHGRDGEYRENLEKFDAVNLKPRSASTLRSHGGRHFLACRAMLLAGIKLKSFILKDVSLGAAVKQDVISDLTLPTLSEFYSEKIEMPIIPIFHALDCFAVSLKFSKLEKIYFSKNSLFDAAIVKFAENLPSAEFLREINLSENCLSTFGFLHLLVHASLSPKLESIDLIANQITLDADIAETVELALKRWKNKKSLSLGSNPINEDILQKWKIILSDVCEDLESKPQSSETDEEISRSIDSSESSSTGRSVDPEAAALLHAVVGDESLPSSEDDSDFTDSQSASD